MIKSIRSEVNEKGRPSPIKMLRRNLHKIPERLPGQSQNPTGDWYRALNQLLYAIRARMRGEID